MDAAEATVVLALGLLQGITEFLPISSDGHLAVFSMLFHVPDASLALTVLLHVGTLLATALVFRADLLQLARVTLREARKPAHLMQTAEGVLLRNIVLASVPTAVIGLALESRVEALSRTAWVVGAGFLISAAAVLSTRGRVQGRDALSVGAALLMRVETSFRILGYPGLAMVCFLAAAGGGVWLVLQIVLADRKSLKDLGKAKEEKQQAASKRA